MKRISIILFAAASVLLVACGNKVKREPGKVYMPDMATSRAYETYADHSNLKDKNINYNNQPVAGTVSREEDYVYHLAKDAGSDTTNYFASRLTENPVKTLTTDEMTEAERQYLINCGICHGGKLDGNGPLWKDGSGPFPAAPKNLMTLDMPDGQMFYSITYGRNLMGSYASQLTSKQRWDIIHYIKVKQGKVSASVVTSSASATDSTATAKK